MGVVIEFPRRSADPKVRFIGRLYNIFVLTIFTAQHLVVSRCKPKLTSKTVIFPIIEGDNCIDLLAVSVPDLLVECIESCAATC